MNKKPAAKAAPRAANRPTPNQPRPMTTIESIREVLSTLDPDALLCDLPDSEFDTGGAITDACRVAGYDESGRVTVNNLNAWGMTVAQFAEYFADALRDGIDEGEGRSPATTTTTNGSEPRVGGQAGAYTMTKKQVEECLESARTGDIEEVIATANVAGIPVEDGDVFAREHVIEALSAAAAILGRKGGQATSEAKAEAARVNAKRGGRPRKQTDDFEYAVQIQPRNGQQLVEYREGLTLTYRDWNTADRKRHPQAERQLWDGACLVVDLDTDNVYAVEKP